MDYSYKKIEKTADVLKNLMLLEKTKIEKNVMKRCGYKKYDRVPVSDESWEELAGSSYFECDDSHIWINTKFTTPKKKTEHQKIYYDLKTDREGQSNARNPQALVYIDGILVQGLDTNHTDVELEFDREYDMYLYLYTGNSGGEFIIEPSLKIIDTKIEQMYYDLRVPFESLMCIDEKDDDAVTTCKYMIMACDLLDLRVPYSKEFYASIDEAAEFLKKEYYENTAVCGKSDCVIDCIGHTHIDVAWLWTLEQTEEKAQHTFATMLKLMEEYDDFKFMSSQPQLYEYVKEYAPELYERIKERIKEGRFEPEGAMWLEADCNLSSGESLVRQIMVGKKFFKEEFDVDSKTLWLPDVFGYSAALPQILKKCGVDKFLTSKISWNDTNQLPYDMFMWEGLDGSEIFSTFITTQAYKPQGERFTTYSGNIAPDVAKGTRHRFQQKEYTKRGMITFGYADGGGGPTRKMLEFHNRMKYGLPGIPKTVMSTSAEYLYKVKSDFEAEAEKLRKIPKWVGELYLEFHRGTYTSMAKNKRNNRKSEFLYQTAEQVGVIANKLCKSEYPQDIINSGWKTILLNQFHDIIPGSSIEEVYIESDREYAHIKAEGEKLLDTAYKAIAGGVDKEKGWIIYNPNSFETDGYAVIDGKTAYVKNVPALGWNTVSAPDYGNTMKISDSVIENKYYILRLDENANICSLYDKEADREVIESGKAGNVIEAFEDLPYNHDNWELSPYYKQKKWDINDVAEFEEIHDGARAGYRIKRRFLSSVITQNIWLYENSRRIDFETVADWKDSHIVLKAAFPVNVHTDKATYETQFGYLERPTHSNTPYDTAKFEVCAHKYADISEDDYGVAILNDCKYGHNTEGNVIKLTMLKAGTAPNENADKEIHTFTYSLYPHTGNHKQGGVIQEAYLLNRPLTAFKAEGSGTLAESFSAVTCNKENIIIETVKKAENSDATVIRAYDAYNRRGKAEFTFGFDIKKAYICDMLENKLTELEVKENRKVEAEIGTFEIVTIMAE